MGGVGQTGTWEWGWWEEWISVVVYGGEWCTGMVYLTTLATTTATTVIVCAKAGKGVCVLRGDSPARAVRVRGALVAFESDDCQR